MATGIGPSSSGSQATVASVVTSTLLAGLGFSGGVISSFPSSVWPRRAANHNPGPTRQSSDPAKEATTSASAVGTAAAKDNLEAGAEDGKTSKGQGEDSERESEDKDEEDEDEDETGKEGKKDKKGSGSVSRAGIKDTSTVANEPPRESPDATAKEKKHTEPDPTHMPPGAESTHSYTPLHAETTVTTVAANEKAAIPTLKDPTKTPSTGRNTKHWPFFIHTGESTHVPKPQTVTLFIYVHAAWPRP